MTRVLILAAFFLLLPFRLASQYYDTGQDPAALKWNQIRTEHFRIIFPESYGAQGIEYARSLEKAVSGLARLYPAKKFNIPVVIHSYSTRSNGYVAWAPSRMELYPAPDQNNIPLYPPDQLAIHEMTHVSQMLALNSGFTKGANWLLGEQITGGVAVFLPLWLLEGEAVFSESALTHSGRGRIPSFIKELKAISVERGKLYGYDKMINGSFRDYIPDHYQLGFQIAAWARSKYGSSIWTDAIKKAGSEPFTLNPVNASLFSAAGTTKKKLFRETFDTLGTMWSAEASATQGEKRREINPPRKGRYINYYSPVAAGTDSVIAVRTSLSATPEFVLINPIRRTASRLFVPGQIYPFYITYGAGKIVWVEYQPDMRWDNRDYSVIRILDLKTGSARKLTSRSRYMAASVSSDGSKIAAIETAVDNSCKLKLLNSSDGSMISEAPSPGKVHLQRPQWSADGRELTVISLTEEGEGILKYNTGNKKWTTLLHCSTDDIQSAYLRNDSLFYVSSSSGTDNIMLLPPGGTPVPLTDSRFGASDITFLEGRLLSGDYSSKGNSILLADTKEIKPLPAVTDTKRSYLVNRFNYNDKPGTFSTTDTVLKIEPYRKSSHLFRFHSWMPFYADLEEIQSNPAAVRPGLTVMSQNNLSTLVSTIGYEYSENRENLLHTSVAWKGWYPVFETEVSYGYKPLVHKTGNNVSDPVEVKKGVSFINTLSLPLRFSSGRFSTYIRPSWTLEYNNDYIYVKEDALYDYGQAISTARLYFSNYHRYSVRDINPKWAQSFDLSYTSAPLDGDIYGSSLSFRSVLYFPGFFHNHSIRLRYETEKQDPVKFMYGNRVPLPRGYTDIRSRERKLITGDYVLPLLYPDINISSLIYITRIRSALFYDYEKASGNTIYSVSPQGQPQQVYHGYEEVFRSYGAEVLADFYLLRLPFMVSSGLQAAWISGSQKPVIKFLFTIDLFGMNIGREKRKTV